MKFIIFSIFMVFLTGCTTKKVEPIVISSNKTPLVPTENIGVRLNSEIFAELDMQSDDTGNFVQIDDMRFRVGTIGTFGYTGKQWANGLLIYELSPAVAADPFQRSQFVAACNMIVAGSGIRCADRTTGNFAGEADHIYVIRDTENYSYVGQVGDRQLLGITSWGNQIIIAHEVKHALGWHHEHQRPNRDIYIQINSENIIPTEKHNFEILNGNRINGPYDFDSIMHYGVRDFSSNGNQTIEALPAYSHEESVMGQRTRLPPEDLQEIQDVYGASGTRWCGLDPKPEYDPPRGCFFACYRATNPRYGEWVLCGTGPCVDEEKCR